MKIKVLISILICLIGAKSFAQLAEDSLLELLTTTTFYLEEKTTIIEKGMPRSKVEYGSGFFVLYNHSIYLVTAKHVAKKMTKNSTITFYDEEAKPSTIKLQELINDTLKWTIHEKADVAALSVHPVSKLFQDTSFNALPIELFYDTLIAPLRRREVVMFGFPLRLGIEKHFSAISTSAKTASRIMDLRNPDTDSLESFFLLDAQSIPGNSGGPAITIPIMPSVYGYFYALKDSINCVGLVHGVIGSFAAIVPSKYIVEAVRKTPRFTGKTTYYYRNGQIWSERIYENGFIKEVLNNYDKNGKPQDKGSLKNGTGTINYYDDEGKLIRIETYDKGILKEAKGIKSRF